MKEDEDCCIFCKLSNNEISAERIYENDNFFSILDANPQVEGHTLVISKRHFETVLDIPNSLGVELLDCIKETAVKLMKKYNAEGFNILQSNYEVAQQEVFHAHFHILPRKKNDGELKFVS